jgi:hypothetical protein
VVAVAPAGLAMAIAVDPVAVLESIRPTILGPVTPGAAPCDTDADESRERAQYSDPIKCIHSLTLSENGACSNETRKFG